MDLSNEQIRTLVTLALKEDIADGDIGELEAGGFDGEFFQEGVVEVGEFEP